MRQITLNREDPLSFFKSIPKEKLANNAEIILIEVFEKKCITTTQLVNLIDSKTRKEDTFSETLRSINDIFIKNNIKITYTSAPSKFRKTGIAQQTESPSKQEAGRASPIPEPQNKPTIDKIKRETKLGDNKISNADNFILTTVEPTQLTERNVEHAVRDNEWFENTYDQERDLFKIYLNEINRYKLLKQKEEIELFKLTQTGDQKARERFIKANLRLVVWVALKYRNRLSNTSMDLLDLVQEGNLGLLHAMELFDLEKGFKFSSYATWWIRQRIYRSLDDQLKVIRFPVHIAETIRKYYQVSTKLSHDLARTPSIEEVSTAMKISFEAALLIEKLHQQNIISIEYNSDDENGGNRDYLRIADSAKTPDVLADENILNRTITKVLKLSLTPKQYDIFVLRYGLNNEKKNTLEEIGKIYGVTRERIRQIESIGLKALEKNAELIRLAKSLGCKVTTETIENTVSALFKKKEFFQE